MAADRRQIPPFGIRMPPEMLAALKTAAVENGRSMNKEIVRRLAISLGLEDDATQVDEAPQGALDRITDNTQAILDLLGIIERRASDAADR